MVPSINDRSLRAAVADPERELDVRSTSYLSDGLRLDTTNLKSASAQYRGVNIVQRMVDFLGAGIGLIILCPIFAIISFVIRLDSPGPVLFVQKRVGKDGKEFPLYKFRSMVVDAEERRHKLEVHNERNGPVFKIKNDPRITRVGRFLRKWSFDELPQLINVVAGHMSLVGPRPALPREVAHYTDYQRQRLAVVPGLTGLWQVSGRSNLSFERSVELDLEYIERRSVGLYFWILWRTVPAILRAEGAY